MYAIYEQTGAKFEQIEEENDPLFSLNETMEMFRQMKQKDPDEFERIANLPDGIRSGMTSPKGRVFVHLKSERFQKLYLADQNGEIVTKDVPEVLDQIRCSEATSTVSLLPNHNAIVTAIQEQFRSEVQQRQTERRYLKSLSQGQKYVLHELRELFSATEDEDKKARINILERAFRNSPSIAINRELNRISKNQIKGETLCSILKELYTSHGLRDRQHGVRSNEALQDTSYLVCSETLKK